MNSYASELETGDRILSGQAFEMHRSRGYALDATAATLQADVTVESVRESTLEADSVVIRLRGMSDAIHCHAARVVRVA